MRKLADVRKSLRLFRAPSSMFWAGFLVRVLYITIVHTYRIRPEEDHLQFGWEMGRIARALATGFGYADPFTGHSGPTAWSPPLYPLLIAGGLQDLRRLHGGFRVGAAHHQQHFFRRNLLGHLRDRRALLSPDRTRQKDRPLVRMAMGSLSRRHAVRRPLDLGHVHHGISLLARSSSSHCASVASETSSLPANLRRKLRQQAAGSPSGFSPELVVLLNSTLLLFLPVCGVWMLLGALKAKAPVCPTLLRGALACVLVLACLAPWMIRNYTVFHTFIPMRGNLGAELHQSILEEHQGFPWGATIPVCEVCPVFQQYRQMGEAAYVRREGELAKAGDPHPQTALRPVQPEALLLLLGQRPQAR